MPFSKFVTVSATIAQVGLRQFKTSIILFVCMSSIPLIAQTVDPRDKRPTGWDIFDGTTRIRNADGSEQSMPTEYFDSLILQENEIQSNFIDNPTYENFQKLSDLQKIDSIASALYSTHIRHRVTPDVEFLNSLVDSSSNYLVQLGAIEAIKATKIEEFRSNSENYKFDEIYLKLFKVAGQQNLDTQATVLCELADGSNFMVTEFNSKKVKSDDLVDSGKADLRLIKLLLRNSVSGINPQNILCTKKAGRLSKNNFFLSALIQKLEDIVAEDLKPNIPQPKPLTADVVRSQSSCDSRRISRALFDSFENAKKVRPEVKHLIGISEPDCFIRGILTKDRNGFLKFSMHPDLRLSRTIEFSVMNSREGYKDLILQILKTQSIAITKTVPVQNTAAPTFSSPPSEHGSAIYSPFAAH